jgi:hypothetical protein
MRVTIETTHGDTSLSERITVTAHEPARVTRDGAALIFDDGMFPSRAVWMILDEVAWRQLERIMQDRAFESECVERELAGEIR